MKAFGIAAAAAALFAAKVAADVDPIVIKGSKFFYKTNGTQFFIKGVAYQEGVNSNSSDPNAVYTDPLANQTTCSRDIPLLQDLQTNTIRVYALDPTQNHDACMQQLANAGIYVIADLSQPGQSINRDTPQWTTDLFNRYTSVIDTMQKYNNVLGFFAGNEISNAANNTAASAFVKAAVRDSKAYIVAKGYRAIGVGYATSDDAAIRQDLANYFDCGDASDAIDFWGYNIYSWCGNSNFQDSGYDQRTQEFASYNVPAFFAEYGCNTPSPRNFTEVQAIYGPNMTGVWSGGIVYMYFQEANNFGLVSVSGSAQPSKLPDYDNLSSQISNVNPTGVTAGGYNPSNTAAGCPSVGTSWAAAATPLPPAADDTLCGCMWNTLSCIVSPSVNESNYDTLFGVVCGLPGSPCAGIQTNATTGKYGAYSGCNSTEQLAFAINQYAGSQPTGGCDFSGSATVKAASKTPVASCKALLNQAGSAGTGTVTASATAGGASGSSSASGSKAAAGMVTVPSLHVGLLQLGLYVVFAVVTGAGMILL